MDELNRLLEEILNIDLRQIVLSNSRDDAQGTKAKVRPVLLKGELLFQETLYKGTQVFHENLTKKDIQERLCGRMDKLFRQGVFVSDKLEASVLVSKKGRMTVKVRRSDTPQDTDKDQGQEEVLTKKRRTELSHDRAKQYILADGVPVDFLVRLGVQTSDGRVTKAKYDKFRQINRYLEFIEDVLEVLPADRSVRIVDFGCGKSYLTFAMYYYLHELRGRDIQVTGLDLKEDVIRHCGQLAKELRYDGLHFERGDISAYENDGQVDMVVSLHACDKATDYALEKAVKWGGAGYFGSPLLSA